VDTYTYAYLDVGVVHDDGAALVQKRQGPPEVGLVVLGQAIGAVQQHAD
jgi:hypothetical protein